MKSYTHSTVGLFSIISSSTCNIGKKKKTSSSIKILSTKTISSGSLIYRMQLSSAKSGVELVMPVWLSV